MIRCLIPEFEIQRMSQRNQRKKKLCNKTVRNMMSWSHYGFRNLLLDKAKKYTSATQVIVVDEAYTSKTCGRCGWIHDRLGGSKVFQCNQCHLRIDRDVNGARNIIMRAVQRGYIKKVSVLR